MRVSLAWWCFAPLFSTPQALIRTAAEIGYDGVELIDPQYWPLCREHGLAIAAMSGHQSIIDGLNERSNHDRICAELTTQIAQAAQWNIPNLICFSGSRADADDANGAAITAAGLQRIAKTAEDAGVTLVLELLNSKVDHPDYQCNHTAWGVNVCEQVNSPNVKLLYDIYHMQIMEGDLIRTIQQQHAHIEHYHVAGNPGRHEPDAHQEISYPAVYHAIQSTGYSGYIGMEFIPRGEPVAALRAALAAVPKTAS